MSKNTHHFNDSQLDAMLAQWPIAARPVGEWDEKVAQLMARLDPSATPETAFSTGGGEGGLHGTRLAPYAEPSDEKILLAPSLDGVITTPKSAPSRVSERPSQAQSTEPGSNETSLEDRMSGAERSRSLKDLAKMAQSSPPSSVSRQAPASVRDDSGMIDLAATFGSDAAPSNSNMGSEPAAPLHSMTVPTSHHAQQSVPHIPAASTLPSFDMSPSSHAMIAAAPPSYEAESFAPISAPPQSAAFVAAPAVTAPVVDHSIYAVPPVTTQKSSGTGKVIAIGLVGLFAVAAAVGGFAFASKAKTDNVSTQVAKNDVAPAAPKAEVAAPAGDQAPGNAGNAGNAGIDLNNIPTTPQAGKPVAQPLAAKPGGPVAAAPLAAAPAPEKPEAKKPDAPKAPEGPAGSLGDAMKQAVGPVADNAGQAKSNEPQFAAGSVPQKPSQGALTSALSSVMGSARSCGSDEEGVSRATVTFGSAGSVQSVNVSGAAAGKPSAECIKGALSKAHVAPFAEPTFTTTVTIRH